ncbi:hypothetical protein PPSIR1_11953 [Plesiocystis pacifica SIR-1]|uniref:Uncharacterized protein n=1 Tax=Plesiocystis pacifica SIR-1 TaxID=391625 RepID=A6GIH7_9BACT|nr:hypothetical protein [Plesiocystis pacifica]EDM74340.1 hypothetical protein PPSIR1_11953 [Plesiocystis pacifica SIR-1]
MADRVAVDLSALPGWPGSGPSGHGWGAELGGLVGSLAAGDLVLVTAAQRGAGRTSLVAQLGDGLALAGCLVILAVDEAPMTWRRRSLARWLGCDSQGALPEGADTAGWAGVGARQCFLALEALALEPSELAATVTRRRQRCGASEGPAVLVVDALESVPGFEAEAAPVLERLAQLAAQLDALVLATSDGPGADSLRLSRAMDRHLAARLELSPAGPDSLEVSVAHRRLGPRGRVRLRWEPRCGRLVAPG